MKSASSRESYGDRSHDRFGGAPGVKRNAAIAPIGGVGMPQVSGPNYAPRVKWNAARIHAGYALGLMT